MKMRVARWNHTAALMAMIGGAMGDKRATIQKYNPYAPKHRPGVPALAGLKALKAVFKNP